MKTLPNHPYRERDTSALLRSLIVAAIMFALLLFFTACMTPPRANIVTPQEAGISPTEAVIIAAVSLLFVLRRKRA